MISEWGSYIGDMIYNEYITEDFTNGYFYNFIWCKFSVRNINKSILMGQAWAFSLVFVYFNISLSTPLLLPKVTLNSLSNNNYRKSTYMGVAFTPQYNSPASAPAKNGPKFNLKVLSPSPTPHTHTHTPPPVKPTLLKSVRQTPLPPVYLT